MRTTGRRWLLAFPLALGLGLLVLPLAKGSVDTSLEGRARAALDAAGVTGVAVTSEWAGLRLSGPAAGRDAALAAVARMDHRDAVARVEYVVPAALATPTPEPTPEPTPSPSATAPVVDVAVDLAVVGTGPARTLRLTGTVAGEQRHAALLAAARAWAPAVRIADDVTVADGEPSPQSLVAWPELVRLVGAVAATVTAPGALHLGPDGLEVSGLASSEKGAAFVAARVEAAQARGLVVRSSVVGPLTLARQRLSAVRGLAGVQFTHGSEVLTPASQRTLDVAAGVIRALPAGVVVEIRGYTDDKGDPQLNQRLSARRAAMVRQYLVLKGVPPSRLAAVGLGEKNPRASNATDAGRAANRRIEFVVKGS